MAATIATCGGTVTGGAANVDTRRVAALGGTPVALPGGGRLRPEVLPRRGKDGPKQSAEGNSARRVPPKRAEQRPKGAGDVSVAMVSGRFSRKPLPRAQGGSAPPGCPPKSPRPSGIDCACRLRLCKPQSVAQSIHAIEGPFFRLPAGRRACKTSAFLLRFCCGFWFQ